MYYVNTNVKINDYFFYRLGLLQKYNKLSACLWTKRLKCNTGWDFGSAYKEQLNNKQILVKNVVVIRNTIKVNVLFDFNSCKFVSITYLVVPEFSIISFSLPFFSK